MWPVKRDTAEPVDSGQSKHNVFLGISSARLESYSLYVGAADENLTCPLLGWFQNEGIPPFRMKEYKEGAITYEAGQVVYSGAAHASY